MDHNNDKIEFTATLAANGAITFSGDGDARIKFETDRTQMASVAALLSVLLDSQLKVTVEVCHDGDDNKA